MKTEVHDRSGIQSVSPEELKKLVNQFATLSEPHEGESLRVLIDNRTGASYCECHLRAKKLIELATIDVPLDPDEQPEYRANREIVEDHVAFERMKDDAKARRTFSNIVTEFTRTFESDRPIKIIGGQHRYKAIQEAYNGGVNELHGLKIYFGLTPDQRLDVQLISNTNIATSTDLFDRMHETLVGPELRKWCQESNVQDLPSASRSYRRRHTNIRTKTSAGLRDL